MNKRMWKKRQDLPAKERFVSRKKWVIITVTLIILFIFTQSAMPKSESSGESGWILNKIVNPILQFFGIDPMLGDNYLRKAAHVTEFIVLAFFTVFLWKGRLSRTIPMCFAAAFLDESIQILSKRGSSVKDIWIDLIGAVIGMAVGQWIWKKRGTDN